MFSPATSANGGQSPAWPPYATATDPFLQIEAPQSVGTGVGTAKCDFWDSLL